MFAGADSQGITRSANVGCEISIVISIMRQRFSSFVPEVLLMPPALHVESERKPLSCDRGNAFPARLHG